MDNGFEVGSREFKLSKLDTFKQFHIVRRLGPILGEVIPVAQKIAVMKRDNLSEEEQLSQAAELARPLMIGLSKLSDEDANFILLGLCESIEMKQPEFGSWARLVKNGQLMFQDMELPVLLQCAGRAFGYNMAGFFAMAPQTSHGGA